MTAEERQEFEAFRQEKQKKAAAERRRALRDQYASLVDDEVRTAIPVLLELSQNIRQVKQQVYDNFATLLKMKGEVMGLSRDDQRSHTFTTPDSRYRLTLGVHVIDDYADTVEDGIAMVKSYIESLAKDADTKALVSAVLRLLSRDGKGTLKASRVLQLRKMADESGDERFQEGVRIIEESYRPTTTRRFIRAEYKTSSGAWRSIPLGMTESDDELPPEAVSGEQRADSSL